MSEAASRKISASGIIALVMGIIALVLSWIPVINNFAFVFAALAIIFAVIGLVMTGRKRGKSGRGLAVAGFVLGIVGLIITLVTQQMYVAALNSAADALKESSSSFVTKVDSSAAAELYPITDEESELDQFGTYRIKGTLTNNSGKDASYISVKYRLLDSDGKQLDTALDSTSNLEAGADWSFSAIYLGTGSDVASYEFLGVTSY